MKIYFILALLFSQVCLFSCGPESDFQNRVRFSKPFPKATKDLTWVLGETLSLKAGEDTFHLAIQYQQGQNLITEVTTKDTLFYGTVSKYRGLYYFNERLSDSAFSIYAVKMDGDLIYSLTSHWVQKMNLYQEVSTGNVSTLVEYVAPDSSLILLRPDRKELKQLFGHLLSNIPPDTILRSGKRHPIKVPKLPPNSTPEEEELSLVSSLYPNPVHDQVSIHLQAPGPVTYRITNLHGKKVMEGTLKERSNKIELSRLAQGIYEITLYKQGQKENLRILKV